MGLRCLFANLGQLQTQTKLLEYTIQDSAEYIVDQWLTYEPKIIGIGIYIWNIELLTNAVKLLKSIRSDIFIIVGGPEVSYGIDNELNDNVDYIVQLEGEVTFRELCSDLLKGITHFTKIMKSEVLDIDTIEMPYAFYNEKDILNRKIYVEASRGCAFKCQFCLSSLDAGIRNFDIDRFLLEMKKLHDRGVRQFKFIDRTFNLNINISTQILKFFLDIDPKQDFFLHFEVIPDRLPPELKKFIQMFKPGVLQFEVGIQTFDTVVSGRIGRRQNSEKAIDNLKFLRHETYAHLHVDLIIGLPGAGVEVFKKDFNNLLAIGLQEVQVGMLKLLKGTPIHQHIIPFAMEFNTNAPYEIVQTKDIDKETMVELRAFHKFFDKYYNSGNFQLSMKYLFELSNPFDEFYALSNYSLDKYGRTYKLSLDQLAESLYTFLIEKRGTKRTFTRELILKDLLNKKGRKVPNFLKDYALGVPKVFQSQSMSSLSRQQAHIKTTKEPSNS